MGNIKKKADARLKRRQDSFDSMRKKDGFNRPGSMNSHKTDPVGRKGIRR